MKKRERIFNKTLIEKSPSLAVLIPCFNEEKTIGTTFKFLRQIDYPNINTIIINDGSTDSTFSVLKKELRLIADTSEYPKPFSNHKIKGIHHSKIAPFIVIDKQNGGKAAALNTGLTLCKTDLFKNRFMNKQEVFKEEAVTYSAFVTLETYENSDVSDDMRYWALENVDSPIFMSYFSCSLDEQKKLLTPYLEYGDWIGKKYSVGIAVLLGTKSVDRDISCECELDEEALRTFLFALDKWASGYKCYGGLVLETNQRFPSVDVFYPEIK